MRSLASHSSNLIARNERGIVLILTLWMLLLLSILGAFATSTSMTEISIAGNYRNAETALNVADAGIAFGQTNPGIYTAIGTGSCPPCDGTSGAGTSPVAVGTNTAQVRVEYIITGSAPAGLGIDATMGSFQSNYFAVTSTGTGPNNSQARIESEVAKLVPGS